MAKYEVTCVRRGSAVVEAESECEALDKAETLPNSAFDWFDAEGHEVVGEVG